MSTRHIKPAGPHFAFLLTFAPMTHSRRHLISLALICLASLAMAQQAKTTTSSASVTGHYEGSAKNKAEDEITVALELTEKDGALSGTINSSLHSLGNSRPTTLHSISGCCSILVATS